MNDKIGRIELARFRYSHFMSGKKIADAIGVSHSTYYRIERGEYCGTFQFWKSLKEHFNLSWEQIEILEKVNDERKLVNER